MATKKQAAEVVDHTERLSAVLSAMGIKRATFVDDQFAPSFADVWASAKAFALAKSDELKMAWGGVDWSSESLEDERQGAETGWNKLETADRVALMARVRSMWPSTEPTLAGDVSFFSQYWPSTCELHKCGPNEFSDDYIRSALLASGPSLLFLDLKLGDGDEEGGVRLLKRVLNADTTKKTVCVIFTSQSGAELPDFWAELASKAGLEPATAVVISKASTSSIESFERELRRALLNSMSPSLMKWAWEIATKALGTATNSASLEGDVLHAVVLQSSEKEGIHPTETLFRLLDEEFHQARERIAFDAEASTGFASFKTKLEALANIAPAEAKSEPALATRTRKLMRRHLYREPQALSGWPSPLWLGDLWEVRFHNDSVEEFVVIGQPCDIILRSDGERSQDWVLLAPIKKDKGKHPENVVELKYYGKTAFDSWFVYLKKARISNVNVLDLVALVGSTIKRAEIAKLKARAHVHNSAKNRTNGLLDWLAALPADATSTLPLSLFQTGLAAKLTNTDEEVSFHCKRIGRIEPELSRLILQRYGNFVSRHALPHDFSDYESQSAAPKKEQVTPPPQTDGAVKAG